MSNPRYANDWLYSISIADVVVPTILGSNDKTYNHHPQHPNGTSEKNEKNDVAAVLPELPPRTEPFDFILQPSFLLYPDRNICNPTPIPIPPITMALI